MNASTFAAKLKALREQAGLTQAALAARAGLTQQAVALLEAGARRPGLATAQALAQALGVTLAEFEEPTKE